MSDDDTKPTSATVDWYREQMGLLEYERAMDQARLSVFHLIAEEVGHTRSQPIEVLRAVERRGGHGAEISLLRGRVLELEAEVRRLGGKVPR